MLVLVLACSQRPFNTPLIIQPVERITQIQEHPLPSSLTPPTGHIPGIGLEDSSILVVGNLTLAKLQTNADLCNVTLSVAIVFVEILLFSFQQDFLPDCVCLFHFHEIEFLQKLVLIRCILFCRSSTSEINRYSPNPEVAHDSEHEAASISPTTGQMRPGKRRRRSDKDNIPPGIRKLPSPPTTLEQAQMEWDLVETVQPGGLAKCNIIHVQSSVKH